MIGGSHRTTTMKTPPVNSVEGTEAMVVVMEERATEAQIEQVVKRLVEMGMDVGGSGVGPESISHRLWQDAIRTHGGNYHFSGYILRYCLWTAPCLSQFHALRGQLVLKARPSCLRPSVGAGPAR